MEGSLYEVGTPSPHNSDIIHGPVDNSTHTHTLIHEKPNRSHNVTQEMINVIYISDTETQHKELYRSRTGGS